MKKRSRLAITVASVLGIAGALWFATVERPAPTLDTPKPQPESISSNVPDANSGWTLVGTEGESTKPTPTSDTSHGKHVDAENITSNDSYGKPTHYERLTNGARITADAEAAGHGILNIDNGSSEDAVVRLADNPDDETIRWVFVRAHQKVSLHHLPPGDFSLLYSMGLDWRADTQEFRWNPSYHRFDRDFQYSETLGPDDSLRFKEIDVTLHAVLNGNIRPRSIS